MQQVDGIDGHQYVRSVLVLGVVELLYGFNGELEEFVLPVLQIVLCPVPVSLSDVHNTVFAQFVDDPLDRSVRDVVTVDEKGDMVFFFGHVVSFFTHYNMGKTLKANKSYFRAVVA
jgi:hypothetical protein